MNHFIIKYSVIDHENHHQKDLTWICQNKIIADHKIRRPQNDLFYVEMRITINPKPQTFPTTNPTARPSVRLAKVLMMCTNRLLHILFKINLKRTCSDRLTRSTKAAIDLETNQRNVYWGMADWGSCWMHILTLCIYIWVRSIEESIVCVVFFACKKSAMMATASKMPPMFCSKQTKQNKKEYI